MAAPEEDDSKKVTEIKWSIAIETRPGEQLELNPVLLGERLFQRLWECAWEAAQTDYFASLHRSFTAKCPTAHEPATSKAAIDAINISRNRVYDRMRERFVYTMWPALLVQLREQWQGLHQPTAHLILSQIVTLPYEFGLSSVCGETRLTLDGVFDPGRILKVNVVYTGKPDLPIPAE